MTDNVAKFLSTVELLQDLNLHELGELAKDFCPANYAPDTDIVKPGEKTFRFFILVTGKAAVIRSKKGNNIFPVNNSFVSGDCFGEITLFTGRPSPVAIRATEESTVLTMNAEKFAQMLLRWPKLYERFLHRLSRLLNQIDDHLWETRYREFLRDSLQLKQLQQKFYGLWGSTKSTRQAEKAIAQLASSREPLLLVGERGTGRQMMAWHIHKRQFGETAPFIVVDAHHFDQQWGDLMFKTRQHDGSLTLIKGASLLDIAEGGTLFIREINLISPRTQQKLAQTLKSFEVNCRIIGCLISEPETLPQSLNNDLRECFTDYHKIYPLRERKRDISVIAQGVLDKLAAQYNRKPPTLDQEAIRFLLAHDYRQGNVTELIRITERAFHLADNNKIAIEHLFFGSVDEKSERSINILSWRWAKHLVAKGIFPLWIKNFITAIFLVVIALFLIGPNFIAVTLISTVAWSLWWPAITILSPIIGRIWCAICPISGVMEWVQKLVHFNLPVPEFLKKYDYLIITFLFFSGLWFEEMIEMRHHPVTTGLFVIGVVTTACIIGIVYTRRTWCRHICPIGNFVGVASIAGLLEVRSNTTVCLNKCTSYECYRGSETKGISGCPTSQYMPSVDNNLDCLLCLQCARVCPNDAVQLNVRIPAREVWTGARIRQGFIIFIAAGFAALGPLLYFQMAGREMHEWRLWFSLSYWGAIIPAVALTWLIARPLQEEFALKRVRLIFALIPLVLAGYMVYQLRFVPGAGSVMLGLGWKTVEGTTGYYVSGLLAGQIWAVITGLAVTAFTIAKILLHDRSES